MFFMLQSTCFAQEQTLFNLNNLINYPLTSLDAEARSIGLQKYVYGNIPDTVNPQNVQWLVIGNNPSTDQNIEKYSNVRYLEITIVGNPIDYSFFKAFKQIEILQLNISVDIPNEVSYLKNLGILKILTDRNISFDGLRDLPRLKLLHIEEGQIQTVPRYLNTFDSLIHFSLFNIRGADRSKGYYEGLTTIKDWNGLSNNKSIENITLQRCGLFEIPEELKSCSNLKTLKFEENPLTDFKNLGELTQIQNLSLKSSLFKIDALPNELLLLKQLKSLNLFQVNTRLDLSGISKLYFLEEFICNLKWDPKRERIPEEIFTIINLKKLILRNSSSIKTLSGIEKLKNLEMLDLESCSFRPNINELILLPKLKWLNLSNNIVENFTLINQIASIETLVLSNCGIKKFSFNEGDFKHLKSLDLKNNPDCVITGPISKLPKLQIIYGSKKLMPANTITELKKKGVILYLTNY